MFPAAAWLLGGCFLLSVASLTGKVLPPQNLSLTWISDFKPRLTWAPPQHSTRGCVYKVQEKTREEKVSDALTWTAGRTYVMNGRLLHLSVITECNGTRSEPAVVNISYPELVKNWSCYIYGREQSYCSWEPATNASGVRFYYRLVKQGRESESELGDSSPMHECVSQRNGSRGCELKAGLHHIVYIVFNETRDNALVLNTFEKLLHEDVRAPPLNWTVHKTEDKFYITWSPPDIFEDSREWIYLINYTRCGKEMTVDATGTSYQLNRLPHCSCRIKMKAVIGTSGGTPWSEEKVFDADSNSNAFVYAAIIIPLLFAGLAALTFVCCRKNMENVFPKIPQPRDLLSDIADNNNKSTVYDLYVPAMEGESCKITLVMDPQVNDPTTDTVATTLI